jgi:hypothetical protein
MSGSPRRVVLQLACAPSLLLLAGCPLSSATRSGKALVEALPIRRVILYQNGVGFFERQGKLNGSLLTLRCRPSQINDLLKSLTVIDRGSGRALSVSLPLERTNERALADLPRQVRDAAGLLEVLRVFRGANVRLHGQRGTAEGRVVGVEQGLVEGSGGAGAGGEGRSPAHAFSVTLKARGGDLAVYPVSGITRVELLDRTLDAGLDRSLDVSYEEGAWGSISLGVRLAGSEEHDLIVSYIVEMPMWKPAYRLVVQKQRPPLLQGWAVVDNVSGESWDGVHLSLVAGTPMSFLYDLHTPRYARRPDLSPRGETVALAPPVEEAISTRSPKDMLQRTYAGSRAGGGEIGGETAEEKRRNAPSKTASMDEPREMRSGKKKPEPTLDASMLNMALENQLQSVKTEVSGEKVGALFRYDLKDPVTVPESSSTLVNIVNSRVPGEEVVLFRPELTSGSASSHPYRAVRFTNETGFALEQGPVTIYSEGTFVGEGFLERLEKGRSLFLTFAIDGAVEMTWTQSYREEAVRLLKIHHGLVESEVLHLNRSVYTIRNEHEAPIAAYVKSQRPSREHKLRKPPKGTVETPDASYIPLELPAGAKRELEIEWMLPVRQQLAVDTSLATSVLRLFSTTGRVPASIKPVLARILALKERMDTLEVELGRQGGLKANLSDDQARVRANLDLLRKVKGNEALKARLTKSLASLEDQLGKITARYVKIDEEKGALLGEMRALVDSISLDAEK